MTAPTANTIPRDHLLGSKWSAVTPADRDKHFTVVRLERAAGKRSTIIGAELEALLSRRVRRATVDELRDPARWLPGWR